jgi:hypothetical protein
MPSLNTGNAILSNAIAVNSSYNVGVGGAASGTNKLQVTGIASANSFIPTSSTIPSNGMYLSAANTLGFATNGTLDMVINEAGNVAIGTNTPFNSVGYTVLDLYGSPVGGHFLVRSPNVTAEYLANDILGEAYIGTRTNHPIIFRTNTTTRLTIAATGAATFSSSVTADGQLKTTATGQSISINAAGTGSVRMQLQNNNTGNAGVAVESSTGGDQFSGTSAYSMAIGTYTARDLFLGTNSVQRFKLDASTGAATFSSTITAASTLYLGYDGTYGSTYRTLGLTGITNGTHRIFAGTTDNLYIAAATSRGIEFWTDGSSGTKMIITSGGNVGIGTSTPVNYGTRNFEINGGSGSAYVVVRGGSNSIIGEIIADGAIYVSSKTAHPLIFRTNDTEKMKITSEGDITFGSSSPSSTKNIYWVAESNELQLNGGNGSNSPGSARAAIRIGDNTTGARRLWLMQLDASNQFATFYYNESVGWNKVGYQTTGGTWTNSDVRRKENITLLNYGLNEILQLIPKKFNFKIDEHKKPQMGFIAQDVLPIIPEAVQSDIDGTEEYYAMNYSNLVPVLVKAIQELNQKINEQQQTINSLINR